MEKRRLKDYKWGDKIKITLMINKIIDRNDRTIWVYAGDKYGEIKCTFNDNGNSIQIGDVLEFKGHFSEPMKPDSFKKVDTYNLEDFLPVVKRPIDEIMMDIERISKEEFKSKEVIELDNYFFGDEEFINKFKRAIGGVYNHHNYLGGLAEHTLGVMNLARTLSYTYNCIYREIAILGAKLHDIGKIYEMNYNGPFSYTTTGSLQGHIVIGVNMVEKAFTKTPNLYSDNFKDRIKGIIVQHHGKLEFGSPVQVKTVESYIVHYADYVDANMNKIGIIGEEVVSGEWSKYDKRLDGRILF